MQKYHVKLTKEERKKIKMVIRSKKVSMEAKKHAQILQDIDETNGNSKSSSEVGEKRGVHANTVNRVRSEYAEKDQL